MRYRKRIRDTRVATEDIQVLARIVIDDIDRDIRPAFLNGECVLIFINCKRFTLSFTKLEKINLMQVHEVYNYRKPSTEPYVYRTFFTL